MTYDPAVSHPRRAIELYTLAHGDCVFVVAPAVSQLTREPAAIHLESGCLNMMVIKLNRLDARRPESAPPCQRPGIEVVDIVPAQS
jgi:hypothetical protein